MWDVYTFVTVSVDECIKGSDILKRNEIIIKILGGSIKKEGIVQYVERQPDLRLNLPSFEKHEKTLLMLKMLSDSTYYKVIHGQSGKFIIQKDNSIQRISSPRKISLEEFIQQIKEIIY